GSCSLLALLGRGALAGRATLARRVGVVGGGRRPFGAAVRVGDVGGRVDRPAVAVGAGGMPAVLAGDAQPGEGRGATGGPLVGAAVLEAGEHVGDLLERADGGSPTGGAHRAAGAELVDDLDRRRRRLVVEELPVDDDDGRVVARRVAL